MSLYILPEMLINKLMTLIIFMNHRSAFLKFDNFIDFILLFF